VLATPQVSDTPSASTLHVQTRVVQVEVVAKDSKGRRVGGLSKNDFTLTDQSKPRVIDIFSIDNGPIDFNQTDSAQIHNLGSVPPARLPLRQATSDGPAQVPMHSTVILLDHVNSDFEGAAWARQGVLDFIGKVEAEERIALYVVTQLDGLVLLQDYTASRELLVKTVRGYVPRNMMTAVE
jgi:VWFA-related protein